MFVLHILFLLDALVVHVVVVSVSFRLCFGSSPVDTCKGRLALEIVNLMLALYLSLDHGEFHDFLYILGEIAKTHEQVPVVLSIRDSTFEISSYTTDLEACQTAPRIALAVSHWCRSDGSRDGTTQHSQSDVVRARAMTHGPGGSEVGQLFIHCTGTYRR